MLWIPRKQTPAAAAARLDFICNHVGRSTRRMAAVALSALAVQLLVNASFLLYL